MKVIKITGIVIVTIVILLMGGCFILNEKEPMGTPTPQADEVARKMMASVNKMAWDTTRYVQWTFMGRHTFFWDKEANLVEVTWKKNKVLIDPETGNGMAFNDGQALEGKEKEECLKNALQYFYNDGFWFHAIVKAFDPGTERSLVTLKDGRQGLKVHYKSGGNTPGDSYVWILDDNYRPTSWKMWVQILPIGGLEVNWVNWDTLSTGAIVSKTRDTKIFDIEMTDVKAGQTLEEFGRSESSFTEIND